MSITTTTISLADTSTSVSQAPKADTDRLYRWAADRVNEGVIRRKMDVDQLDPKYRDARISSDRQSNRRQLFGLSMSDFFKTRKLAEELPVVAMVAVERNDPKQLAHVLAQLDELARWRPLNRPGWTLYKPGPSVPEDHNDGNWLGTGLGLRAIVQTREVLGDRIPPALDERLKQLMRHEIASVSDDFATGRPWYTNHPVSNQYTLPNTGVVLACVALGHKVGQKDYDQAVHRLLRTADTQGRDGAHHEGSHYGTFTMCEVLYAAAASASIGDRRLIDHPAIKHLGDWAVQLIQPGERLVNTFDGSNVHFIDAKGELTYNARQLGDCLMLSALIYDRPELWQALPRTGLTPLAAMCEQRFGDRPVVRLPSFAVFKSSPLVTWRSAWTDDATSIWIRGGSKRDMHDHHDRGHVNLIIGGREVLTEAGTTSYASKDFGRFYRSGLGHNVLQVGLKRRDGEQRRSQDAAIQVHHLDDAGGDVTVDPTASYHPKVLSRWRRRVKWSQQEFHITDQVQLSEHVSDVIVFRWRLAEEVRVVASATDGDRSFVLRWPGGAMRIIADRPVSIHTHILPRGLSPKQSVQATVIEVRTTDASDSLHLVTQLDAANFERRGSSSSSANTIASPQPTSP